MPIHTRPNKTRPRSIRKYKDAANAETRALQIYTVLLGFAQRRQTLSYKELALLMGYSTNGQRGYQFLGPFLGYVLAWCLERKLPPLNFLVVNQKDGVPGFLGPDYDVEGLPATWQLIFETRWFEYELPTIDELRRARNWAAERNWAAS